jgi:hypothetical protein
MEFCMSLYVLGALVTFAGGFVQGCLGFGLGIICVPPLMMLFPVTTVIPMVNAISLVLSVPLGWHARRHLKPDLAFPLIGGSICGLPLGMVLLDELNGPGFKIGVGIFLVILAAILISGWKHPVKNQKAAIVPIGFSSGVLQTTISISGPPIILFLASQNTRKEIFRANLLIYFAAVSGVTTTIYFLRSVYTVDMLKYMGVYMIGVSVGAWMGTRMSQYISQAHFERATLLAAACMGVLLIVQNL